MSILEIGSTFWLSHDNIARSDELNKFYVTNQKKNISFFSSCRNAISVILDVLQLSNTTVIVPPFTCHAVLQPFLTKGMKVEPYHINQQFEIDLDNIFKLITQIEAKVLIIHPYFGLCDSNIMDKIVVCAHNQNVIVIEDRTHSMFSSYKDSKADFVVGSLRKWLPIPDGGFLMTDECLPKMNLKENHMQVELVVKAFEKKYDYLFKHVGNCSEYRDMFAQYEKKYDDCNIIYDISKISKGICNEYNWERMITTRQNNFKFLLKNIKENPFLYVPISLLPKGFVPFMFPIFVAKNKRKSLQTFLAKKGIFATVIWACPKEIQNKISKLEQDIYDEILCLCCDQRYKEKDMTRIATNINLFFKEAIK